MAGILGSIQLVPGQKKSHRVGGFFIPALGKAVLIAFASKPLATSAECFWADSSSKCNAKPPVLAQQRPLKVAGIQDISVACYSVLSGTCGAPLCDKSGVEFLRIRPR